MLRPLLLGFGLLGVIAGPRPVLAAPAPAPTEESGTTAVAEQDPPAPAEADATSGVDAGTALHDSNDGGPESEDDPGGDEAGSDAMELENRGGGVAGGIVDPNDPNAQRAKSDLEGESLERGRDGVPERLPPLARAAWWNVLGTVALASAGGVFAGLVERQESEMRRVALGVDLSTGSRYRYGSVSSLYDDMDARAKQYAWASRGLFIASGVTAVAAITFFALQHRRNRVERSTARRVQLELRGATLRF